MGNFFILSSSIVISLFFVISKAESESESELLADLFALQSHSKSGVIHLDDRSVARFLTSPKTPRPYSLLVFFDAVQLRDKPDLRLRELSQEFAVIASSFIANHNSTNPKLFFCDIEFRESQTSFSLFDVVSLPSIYLVGRSAKSLKDDSERMEQADFTRFTESVVDFIESRTKLTVGPLHRPPLISRTQMGIIFGILLIWSPLAAKKVLSGETWVHNPRVWLSGAIFIYFFSVSGTMHTVIRRMPMFLMDREDPNRLIFFYRGTGVQLGLEGFAAGFLYTIVGLLLAFVTHVLVNVKDPKAQRVAMLVSVLVSFWAVRQVIFLDNWKTGYAIHGFWPSSWN
ncbi:ATU, oligosaccharyltransferase subunit 3/6 [Hibiscus trionum]|uniref:ATU, oligosaccharyltransferase subunit 3/6 n=1 Tax=Hibiscus trionum TaxID=183268 RepID=A0A9W7M4I0_HIBTR|nr:ATU, oligosaccharyltransferase subunit 3/6 [Hibiscus trionum]